METSVDECLSRIPEDLYSASSIPGNMATCFRSKAVVSTENISAVQGQHVSNTHYSYVITILITIITRPLQNSFAVLLISECSSVALKTPEHKTYTKH